MERVDGCDVYGVMVREGWGEVVGEGGWFSSDVMLLVWNGDDIITI